jgi:protoporphyrinogen oxidase
MKLESSGPEEGFPNLQVQLERTFGVGFSHYLFAPVLTKFLGDHPLNVLAVDTHKLFGLRRIVIDSPEATRMLKQRPFFDERIAFHASSEGAASHAQFYPKRGGVDDWMKKLATAAEDAGVEILTSTKVTAVRCERNRLSELGFSNGTIIRPDSVFWSAPLFTLGKLLPSAPPPVSPVFRKSVLVHLVFDEAPTIDSFYVLCFDPRLRNFRTTLYSNFQPGSDTHRATVEFLLSPEDPAHETHFIETAKRELASMGIFPPRARVLAAHFHEIQNGFPVLTTQSQKAKAQQLDWFAQHLTNVAMIGRANTKHWFMVDVLRDILTKTQ